MIPQPLQTAYTTLVERFGQQDGTLLYNRLCERCGMRVPLAAAAFRALQRHLDGLNPAGARELADRFFDSPFHERLLEEKDPAPDLLERAFDQFAAYSTVSPEGFRLPDGSFRMVYEYERVNPVELTGRLDRELVVEARVGSRPSGREGRRSLPAPPERREAPRR